MKIKGMSGEFAFKALIRQYGSNDSWRLTEGYFFEKPVYIEGCAFRWPVEIDEHGVAYVPSQEELQEDL